MAFQTLRILLATANALRESNDQSEKPMPWMTAKAHIKKARPRASHRSHAVPFIGFHWISRV